MLDRWRSLVHLMQFIRLPLAFNAVGNSWLMIFLAYHQQGHSSKAPNAWLTDLPWGIALVLGALVALGLHAYGMALNDLLDARHDRLFRPDRPVAAGQISPRTAIAVAILGLLLAVLAVLPLGPISAALCLMVAILVLFFNAVGKHLPAVGMLTLGLVRLLHMALPNPQTNFLWPILFTFTLVVLTMLITHSLEGKRPRLVAMDWALLLGGWMFVSLAMVVWMKLSHPVVGGLVGSQGRWWIGPLAALAIYLPLVGWILKGKLASPRSRRLAGGMFFQASMCWLILLDGSWLLGAQMYGPAACVLSLLVLEWMTRRFLGAMGPWIKPPPAYRLSVRPV